MNLTVFFCEDSKRYTLGFTFCVSRFVVDPVWCPSSQRHCIRRIIIPACTVVPSQSWQDVI